MKKKYQKYIKIWWIIIFILTSIDFVLLWMEYQSLIYRIVISLIFPFLLLIKDIVMRITENVSLIQKIRMWRRGEMEGEKLVKPKIEIDLEETGHAIGSTKDGLIEHDHICGIIVKNVGKSGSTAEGIKIITDSGLMSIDIGVEKIKDKGIYYEDFGFVREFNMDSKLEERYLDSGEFFMIGCDSIFSKKDGTLIVEYESRAESHYHASISVIYIEKKISKDSVVINWEKIKNISHNGILNGRGIFNKIKKECNICQYKQIIKKVK